MWILLPLIGAIAYGLAELTWAQQLGLGALPMAIVLGMVVGNLFTPTWSTSSEKLINFSKKRLLRIGIILFGSHLTLQQLVQVGWQAAVLDLVVICSVLSLGYWLGVRVLGMSREVTILTSVGSAVCGAAAILATEPVLKAKQQEVCVAVATVVVFGTLALFCYPLIYHLTDLSSASFGIYIGSTVHEVAQAVAAGQAIDADAMNSALITKLMRVMMLAPVVVVIGWLYQRAQIETDGGPSASIPWPWFVFGFIAMVTLNSLVELPAALRQGLQVSAQLALTLAMTALGLQTRFSALRQAGAKPLILSALLFVLLLGGGLLVHQLLY
ncbi:YeiH family protein [Reinekea sp.]|jgi:uncharacterized integral membrane protein (TIGR00698 family)|uniref:YeiH family protein n=1 Tax=Reinekea sp. TaxID=1970455 RepID=UPI002A803A5F|nr:YeiH family protein [Reinekea sp.]